VNGGIEVETTGRAQGQTVNGGVKVALGRADWSGEWEFLTVNGGIEVTLPANANLRVEAETVNGDISTDFPLTVQGRFGPRSVHGTIGSGGRDLELSTVNGSIRLRKAS
jgi:DUF4097 and DUF4098 domain-containing protein YvlB